MSTATKTTTASRFQAYANTADERAMDRVTEDGLDAPLCEWLVAHPTWRAFWHDHLAWLADRSLRATSDAARDEAAIIFKSWLRARASDYIAAWTDEMREGFMAQIDAETAESKRLDLAEGIDD